MSHELIQHVQTGVSKEERSVSLSRQQMATSVKGFSDTGHSAA